VSGLGHGTRSVSKLWKPENTAVQQGLQRKQKGSDTNYFAATSSFKELGSDV